MPELKRLLKADRRGQLCLAIRRGLQLQREMDPLLVGPAAGDLGPIANCFRRQRDNPTAGDGCHLYPR